MHGALLIDKPKGMTSHDVVAAARRASGVRKIGHTGTLDPLACGLLMLLIGQATKKQQMLQGHDKVYSAVVKLGVKTDTADAEGRVIQIVPVGVLSEPRVTGVLASLEGPMIQTPPAFSAVKVSGKPSYWWARRQNPVVLSGRPIRIYSLSLVQMSAGTLHIRVSCSAGTYVRALAESIAEHLGTVGHVTALTRESIGPWKLENACSFDWLKKSSPEAIATRLITPEAMLDHALAPL